MVPNTQQSPRSVSPLSRCEVPGCSFAARTSSGLTNHVRQAHPADYEDLKAKRAQDRADRRAYNLWQPGELDHLARTEVALLRRDPALIHRMNQVLTAELQGPGSRSQASVTGARRREAYKALVARYLAEPENPMMEGQLMAPQQVGTGDRVQSTSKSSGDVSSHSVSAPSPVAQPVSPRSETQSPSQQSGETSPRSGEPTTSQTSATVSPRSPGSETPAQAENFQPEELAMDAARLHLHQKIAGVVRRLQLDKDVRLRGVFDPAEPSLLTRDPAAITSRVKGLFLAAKEQTQSRRKRQAAIDWTSMSNRDKKRLQRKITQKRFNDSPAACTRAILEEKLFSHDESDPEEVAAYWRSYVARSVPPTTQLPGRAPRPTRVEEPFTLKEVKLALEKMNRKAAPGLDGVTYVDLKSAGERALLTLALLFQAHRILPTHLHLSRVVFIPKIKNPRAPSDFRPISVCSVVVRFINSLIAARLNLIDPDPRQVAYKRVEGTAVNCYILLELVRWARQSPKPLCLAFLDVAKAFDSVTHPAIESTLRYYGVPENTVEYLMMGFGSARSLIGSEEVHPTAGIGQGKPESGTIFNLVVARALESLNPLDGLMIDDRWLTHLSFADDTVLISKSLQGLQRLMDNAVESLKAMGLALNPRKCASIIFTVNARKKQGYVDMDGRINVGSSPIPQMGCDDLYKYLGVKVGVHGVDPGDVQSELEIGLGRLSSAKLDPQQKMWALRVCLLPKFIYSLVYSDAGYGRLKKLDLRVRKEVRKWLHLPHDVPTSVFHASVGDGGLGVMSYLTKIPRLQTAQALRLKQSDDWLVRWVMRTSRSRMTKRLTKPDVPVVHCKVTHRLRRNVDVSGERQFWRERLEETVDFKEMRDHRLTEGINRWVCDPFKVKLTGGEYVKAIHVRLKCLDTPSRRGRFETSSIKCGACTLFVADLSHISQSCPLTQGLRIERHNKICRRLKKWLVAKGATVVREPRIEQGHTVAIPDIIMSHVGGTSLLDPTVCGKVSEMETRYLEKREKYSMIGPGDHYLIKDTEPFCGMTGIVMTYRGGFHEDSLRKLTISQVKLSLINYLIVGMLVDTWHMWRAWRDHPVAMGYRRRRT